MKRSNHQNHFILKKATISQLDNLSLQRVKGGVIIDFSFGGSSCTFPTITVADNHDPFVKNNH